jgi:hypothetical protein
MNSKPPRPQPAHPLRAEKKLPPGATRILALIVAGLLTGCGPSTKAPEAQAATSPKTAPAPAVDDTAKAPEAVAKDETTFKLPAKFEGLTSARAEKGYVAVLYQTGRKAMFPTAALTPAETEWLTAFATAHPLAHGKSTVVTDKTELKKTIEKQSVENGLETVQLCAPAKLRDQIGGTCMFYGRVHYLDIAGYPIQDGEIYRTINVVPHDEPYLDYHYYVGMLMLFMHQKPSPVVHFPNGTISQFEWARQELRKGRPILSALPEDIWLSLPADFLATHPFDGNSKIGHQVVVNGFTYNPATKKGTFHVVNSWRVLPEFDVPVEPKDEAHFLMEQSLSPRGEPPEQAAKITAGTITKLKPIGAQFLFSVETNLGPQRVLAADEAAAKQFVEADTSAKDVDTLFGEFIIRIYDYIYDTADPKIRDEAAALLMSEIFKIPESVTLPHVDLEVKSATGNVYFVRVSSGEALDKAQRMMPAPKG